MARKLRPVPLTPAEQRFRLDEWVVRNLIVEERSGPEWVCVCPQCGRSKLAIHIGRKAFQCLSGHCRFSSWSPTVLVSGTMRVSKEKAAEIVAAFSLGAQLGPVAKLEDASIGRTRPARKLPPAPLPLCTWNLLPIQRQYVRSRGIPDDHAQLFGLGTVMSDGTGSKADRLLSGRIMFPIWGPSGRIVFWVAREPGDGSPIKTLNTPRSCREDGHAPLCTCYHDLWGLVPVPDCATADEVVLGTHLIESGGTVIVVEGPVDAAVCGPGFVATLRSWCSPEQAAWIGETGAREAVILYDGDNAGEKGARKASVTLGAVLPTRIAMCPEGEDPGSLGRARSLEIAMAAPRAGGIGQLREQRYRQIPRVQQTIPVQEPLGGWSSADRKN